MSIVDSNIDPLGDGISFVGVVQHMGSDKMIVNAARVSFGQDNDKPFDESDKKLLGYLFRNQHGTPFEHVTITFKVVAPISVMRQWVRHRMASYNEISTRYKEMAERFYVPRVFRGQSKSNRQASDGVVDAQVDARYWAIEAQKAAYGYYRQLLALGVAREQARDVLPLSLYTEFYVTVNARSLMHFVELRDSDHAQWEIRQYAKALVKLAKEYWPETMALLEDEANGD